MPNRLVNENSLYLLQHAENPVNWYPWGEEALAKARAEDKPIFLSIGYAACHWCHVMERESFEDPDTAALMNEHFVNIKVDREERPDLDSIYMQAVVSMIGQGGWPLSAFLSPNGQTFYGGTYFPPVQRYNIPAFKEVLLSIAKLWREDREKLISSAQKITDILKSSPRSLGKSEKLEQTSLGKAGMVLAQNYDWSGGGWGSAPKFPQPMVIEFLLRQATRKNKLALDITVHALTAMAKGGMFDVVGGGFARYSVDDIWLVPHFEKMLYDNAQLALVYLHAYLITGNKLFRVVCERTLDFVIREMTHSCGGFYSSLDADSEGEEGKFYVWSRDEILSIFTSPEDAQLMLTVYGVTEKGNFEGSNVLQQILDHETISEEFNIQINKVHDRLAELNSKLLKFRDKNRVRPDTDDKVLVSWNGLMLRAFAEAGRYLKREDYIQTAKDYAEFILSNLVKGGRLLRSWRDGSAQFNAYLEDYGSLFLALIALYQSDADLHWYHSALNFADKMVSLYGDPDGGFFDTSSDHETLLLRPKDLQDNATPSGNAFAVNALLQLSAYTGNGEWRDIAEDMLLRIQGMAKKHPNAFGDWLCAIDFALGPTKEVVILNTAYATRSGTLREALWSSYRPRVVAAISEYPSPVDGPPLLRDRKLVNDLPTAYVCKDFFCLQPVTTPEELEEQLVEESEGY